ncbi:unnamed protein product, partial [Ectocarpus sp. 12 AP-2014]
LFIHLACPSTTPRLALGKCCDDLNMQLAPRSTRWKNSQSPLNFLPAELVGDPPHPHIHTAPFSGGRTVAVLVGYMPPGATPCDVAVVAQQRSHHRPGPYSR